MYIILSGFPKHHKKHQKIIKFPITAICTYVFHCWKTKLKINPDKQAEYRCTWSLYQPPKGSSNSKLELTRDFLWGKACLTVQGGRKKQVHALMLRSPSVKAWAGEPGWKLTWTAPKGQVYWKHDDSLLPKVVSTNSLLSYATDRCNYTITRESPLVLTALLE